MHLVRQTDKQRDRQSYRRKHYMNQSHTSFNNLHTNISFAFKYVRLNEIILQHLAEKQTVNCAKFKLHFMHLIRINFNERLFFCTNLCNNKNNFNF